MENLFNFKDTNALITGGSSGIGEEVAKCLYSLGSNVLIIGRTQEKLDSTLKNIRETTKTKDSGNIEKYICDVADIESVSEMSLFANKLFSGKLNILINSAGTNIRDSIEDIKFDDWKKVLDTNLDGTFLVTQACLDMLKNSTFGRIINLASIFSSVSYHSRGSYSSSKGAVLMFTKTIAIELAKLNITANCLSPGPLLTEINKSVLQDKENYNKFCENIPIGRFGNPNEILTAVLFLSSEHSSYVTGANIVVDGGWTSS